MKGLVIIAVCTFLVSFTMPPVETDYRKVFGDRYRWAVDWLKQNDGAIHEYACAFNIDEKELKAIVFPELIRYNEFFNAIEIESLKYLYVSEGREYADFSVGYFQMKPSFGEMVERDAIGLLPEPYRLTSGWSSQDTENEASRKARVKRLSNVNQQLLYLGAFYKLCEKRFKGRKFASPQDKLKMYATCYNAGYKRSEAVLSSCLKKSDFYGHNYSDISAYYFRNE